jgi:hypothetical protein
MGSNGQTYDTYYAAQESYKKMKTIHAFESEDGNIYRTENEALKAGFEYRIRAFISPIMEYQHVAMEFIISHIDSIAEILQGYPIKEKK